MAIATTNGQDAEKSVERRERGGVGGIRRPPAAVQLIPALLQYYREARQTTVVAGDSFLAIYVIRINVFCDQHLPWRRVCGVCRCLPTPWRLEMV